MNKVILIGNLSKDPDTKTTGSGLTVCSFTLAVNRKTKNAEGGHDADFVNIVAWRQLGDLCGKYLAKGRKCCVTGQLQTRTYKAQDGSTRYATEVVADEVEFLTPAQGKSETAPAPSNAAADLQQVDDGDLPF